MQKTICPKCGSHQTFTREFYREYAAQMPDDDRRDRCLMCGTEYDVCFSEDHHRAVVHNHPLGAVRARLKTLLGRAVLIGPVAVFVADKIAHLLGICIGG